LRSARAAQADHTGTHNHKLWHLIPFARDGRVPRRVSGSQRSSDKMSV
jgi:hypothetical protein